MNGTRTPKDALILFEKRAATSFEEAYPLGNGHLGAMVYGGAMQEQLLLNHDELWTGYPRQDRFRGEKKVALDRAKAMVHAGKYAAAQEELGRNFGITAGIAEMLVQSTPRRGAYPPRASLGMARDQRAGAVCHG